MKIEYSIADNSLSANLAKLPNAVNWDVQVSALKAGAEPIREEAEILAPRDEDGSKPHLDENIIAVEATIRQLEELGDETPFVVIGPNKDVFYGFFQEYGYGPGPAQPFMRPAFDTNVQNSLKIVQAHLWAALERGAA